LRAGSGVSARLYLVSLSGIHPSSSITLQRMEK
jgi:hypothetical protein